MPRVPNYEGLSVAERFYVPDGRVSGAVARSSATLKGQGARSGTSDESASSFNQASEDLDAAHAGLLAQSRDAFGSSSVLASKASCRSFKAVMAPQLRGEARVSGSCSLVTKRP